MQRVCCHRKRITLSVELQLYNQKLVCNSSRSLSLFQPTRHLTTLCLFANTLYIKHSTKPPFGDADIWNFPEEDMDLPKLYWIPKLQKNPYKQRYIAGSAKCSTKPLFWILRISQRKIWTFPNCTGFLNFKRIRTSRDILRVQQSAQPSLFFGF